MRKNILYGDEARQKLKSGVDKIANAVTVTLGPKGRNVSYNTAWDRPKVVHDGVTVAKEVELVDSFENMGAQLAREAAEKTNDKAGDGTTTSMLLTQAIVTEGIRNISAGANPMALKRDMEKAADLVIKEIKKVSKQIVSKEEKAQVATISAQDEKIGNLIAEAMEAVGNDGVITVEEGKGFDIELEYKEGMQFEHGYASPYFVTKPDKMEAVLEDVSILLINNDVNDVQSLIMALDTLIKVSKRILIIADDFDDSILATLALNKVKGVLNVLAVKAPSVTIRRKEIMEDMAILTGAKVISESLGKTLNSITPEDLGHIDKVISTRDDTTIIGGAGNKDEIEARIEHIKKLLDDSPTEFDKEKLRERLSAMTNGVAVINVGAASEIEQREKKLRVEDAVNATKAAVEEGIVAGGGVALLNAREVLGESLGERIIHNALAYPIKKIVENAGINSGEVIANIRNKGNKGFNVTTLKYEDMIKSGIIDPAKVVISALLNAVSVATMILTTDCLICETEEEREKRKLPPLR